MNTDQIFYWGSSQDQSPDRASTRLRVGEPISGYQDPEYDLPDIWNPGLQARLSVRFIF